MTRACASPLMESIRNFVYRKSMPPLAALGEMQEMYHRILMSSDSFSLRTEIVEGGRVSKEKLLDSDI